MKKADCTNEEIIHIGDSLLSDVLGAQRAGIANVWLNRKASSGLEVVQPENEIKTLTELLDLMI